MKRVIVDNILKEKDVHPKEIFSKYFEILNDITKNFSKTDVLNEKRDCPACGEQKSELAFDKALFDYHECSKCATLYVKNTINKKKWDLYRRRLDEEIYTHDRYKEMIKNELDTVWGTRCSHLEQITRGEAKKIAYGGIRHNIPLEYLKGKLSKCSFIKLSDASKVDIIVLYDYLEHVVSPMDFIRECHDKLNTDGQIIITTRSSSGFDIQVLWGDSVSVHPLEHYNLISVEGIKLLLDTQFNLSEVSTPGQLDLEIVQKSKSLDKHRFLHYISRFRDKDLSLRFQTFLQENLLSSHLRVVGQKK